uniref:RxLR effector candidate protein n=1 Tax=Peronospora matthiolae TaxID=2874970 RepID=A0AAV1U6M6_9STRA
MRYTLVITALLASSVMLTYVTNSFADPSLNVAEANSQAELRSPPGDSKDTYASQLQRAHETTNPEERIPSMISTALERINSFAAKIYGVWQARAWLKEDMSAEAILNQFHAKLPSIDGQNDFEAVWNSLRQRDLLALKKFMEVTTKKDPHGAGVLMNAFLVKYGSAATTEVLLKAQVSGKNFRAAAATEILDEQVHGWFREGKSIPDVFHTLGPLWGYKIFELPFLERLRAYIECYNLRRGTAYTLQDMLREQSPFPVAVFSTLVADAKAVPHASDIAKRVQGDLVAEWNTRGLSVDDVIDMLIPHPLNLFENKYRDTVIAFMVHKGFKEEERNAYLNRWLMESFGRSEFKFAHQLVVLQKYEGQAEAARQCETWLFQQWKDKGKTFKSLFYEIDECEDISTSVAIEIVHRYARWSKTLPK